MEEICDKILISEFYKTILEDKKMLNTVIGIILLVAAVFLVISILLQSSKSHKMPGTIAGGAETFFGKSKAKTWDKVLARLTTIAAIVFGVLVLVMYVIVSGIYA